MPVRDVAHTKGFNCLQSEHCPAHFVGASKLRRGSGKEAPELLVIGNPKNSEDVEFKRVVAELSCPSYHTAGFVGGMPCTYLFQRPQRTWKDVNNHTHHAWQSGTFLRNIDPSGSLSTRRAPGLIAR